MSDSTRSGLRTKLLGRFILTLDGKPVQLMPSEQTLLALLALRGGQSRSRAAGTLWPELPGSRALACLRTGIWRLGRRGLRLIVSGDWIELPAAVTVDVHDLPAVLSAWWTSGAPVGDPTRWELLPGWFQGWVLVDRERIRQRVVHVLEANARAALGTAAADALVWARLAVDAGPLRESAHQLVLRAHLAAGNTAAAMRYGEEVCALLANELGVAPCAELRQLMDSCTQPTTQPSTGRGSNRLASNA